MICADLNFRGRGVCQKQGFAIVDKWVWKSIKGIVNINVKGSINVDFDSAKMIGDI